jgi:hypothetical protein
MDSWLTVVKSALFDGVASCRAKRPPFVPVPRATASAMSRTMATYKQLLRDFGYGFGLFRGG